MPELMTCGAVPVDRLEKRLRRRHADVVARDVVIGPVPTDAQGSPGRADQRLGLRLDEVAGDRRWAHSDGGGQAFALLCIEDGEALEERDGARRLAFVTGSLALVVGHEPVSVHDRGTPLSLAHIAAEAQSLSE